jgi:hypothetical protein
MRDICRLMSRRVAVRRFERAFLSATIFIGAMRPTVYRSCWPAFRVNHVSGHIRTEKARDLDRRAHGVVKEGNISSGNWYQPYSVVCIEDRKMVN